MVDIVDPRGAEPLSIDTALTVSVTLRHDDLVVLTGRGEIDLYTAPILRQAMAAHEDAARMVLDFTGIDFCGVAGAHVLEEGLRHAGGGLSLVVATIGVRRLLQLTGLDRRIPTYRDLAEALRAGRLASTVPEEDAGRSLDPP